jgi:N6-L-threonylcarbamoyladenine synthase
VPLPEINMYNKKRNNFNFSYSGLKTAVLYHMKKKPGTRPEDVCASFRRAAVEILVKKSFRLCAAERIGRLVIGGGVAANSYLRSRFAEEGIKRSVKVLCPPARLTADNAAMIAGLGYHRLAAGGFDLPDLNAYAENDLPFAKGVL